jgi:molybdopterin converting factor small subunit
MVCINYNCYSLKKITKTSFENITIKEKTMLGEVLNILIDKYGELFKLNLFAPGTGKLKLIILVNGVSEGDLNFNICDKDRINIVSPITGG